MFTFYKKIKIGFHMEQIQLFFMNHFNLNFCLIQTKVMSNQTIFEHTTKYLAFP